MNSKDKDLGLRVRPPWCTSNTSSSSRRRTGNATDQGTCLRRNSQRHSRSARNGSSPSRMSSNPACNPGSARAGRSPGRGSGPKGRRSAGPWLCCRQACTRRSRCPSSSRWAFRCSSGRCRLLASSRIPRRRQSKGRTRRSRRAERCGRHRGQPHTEIHPAWRARCIRHGGTSGRRDRGRLVRTARPRQARRTPQRPSARPRNGRATCTQPARLPQG
jgi:hypothetical protein